MTYTPNGPITGSMQHLTVGAYARLYRMVDAGKRAQAESRIDALARWTDRRWGNMTLHAIRYAAIERNREDAD